MSRSRAGRWLGGGLALLLVLGVLGWWFRGHLPGGRGVEEPTMVSPEAAAVAEAKLERLRAEREAVRLSEVELASLVRHRAPRWATSLLLEPSLELGGESLTLSGRVLTGQLPSHEALDPVRAFLPDTANVEIIGHLRPLEPGRAAFEVREVTFAGIPIPARYYPAALERIGRYDEPGLPPTALAVPLPDGVGAVRIESGYLLVTP
jgi:hypothetical protein